MNSPEQVSSTAVPQEASHRNRNVLAVGGVVGAAALASTLLVATGNNPFSGTVSAEGNDDVATACSSLTFENVTANPRYNATAALEGYDIAAKKDAPSIIKGQFNKEDGPLAGAADIVSVSGVRSFIVQRATNESAAVDASYDYKEEFVSLLSKYSKDGGLEIAREDCVENYETLAKSGEYVEDWANGEAITLVKYVRNDDYEIVDLTFEEYVAAGKLSGIEYAYRDSAKGITKSFPSVLHAEDGNMYIKGYKPVAGKSDVSVEGAIGAATKQTGTNKSESDAGSSKQNKDDQESDSPSGTNGGTSSETGSNGGNTGNNGGEAPTGSNGGDAPTGTNGGTEVGQNGCGKAGQPKCGGADGGETGNEGTGDGDGGESGGNTGGGEEPAPAPKPQPTQEPAPKPQPTQEPAPKPQPTKEPQPEPTKEPEPTQPPKGEETETECTEHTPEGCN